MNKTLNIDQEYFGNIQLTSKLERDIRATYCSHDLCVGKTTSSKRLVFVGEYLNICPTCKKDRVVHDTVTPTRARRWVRERKLAKKKEREIALAISVS
jgi:hypothetical protein